MFLLIASYVAITGAIAIHVSALQEAEMKILLKHALKKWAIYLAIGALALLWIEIGQVPDILP